MRYKAVVFDLDGTLLNTLDDIADGMNHVLAEKGLPVHPVEAYKYFVGSGVGNLVRRALLPDSPPELADEAGEAYVKYYAEHSADKTRPYDGILPMLRRLNQLDIPIAVLSNKTHTAALAVVAQYFEGVSFAAVLGERQGVPIKPDPAGARELADYIGVAPGEILYLGDTSVDMQTAVNAGMTPVGVLWGFRKRDELEENGAAHIIGAPEELFRLIGEEAGEDE